jgi:hypothetical protein
MSFPDNNGRSGANASISLTSHFNNVGLHSIAISLSIADNALMHFVGQKIGTSNIGSNSHIETINHPLPWSINTKTRQAMLTTSAVGACDTYTD